MNKLNLAILATTLGISSTAFAGFFPSMEGNVAYAETNPNSKLYLNSDITDNTNSQVFEGLTAIQSIGKSHGVEVRAIKVVNDGVVKWNLQVRGNDDSQIAAALAAIQARNSQADFSFNAIVVENKGRVEGNGNISNNRRGSQVMKGLVGIQTKGN